MAIIKNKGTPNLLNSSDNIDGTQTFLTQLSAVKPLDKKTSKIYLCAMFTKVILCSGNYSPTGKQDFAIGLTDRCE